ncbi:MAG: sigma-70 family RNA polymerase sigma factor, partial [Planctomycetales bacterium]
MPDDSIDLLARIEDGDEQAAQELFQRFLNQLTRIVRSQLSNKLARRIDPEDVVQSAYRSFFLGARDGDFELRASGDLWRLLVGITLNKLRTKVKFHRAQKRSSYQEDSAARDSLAGIVPEEISREPTPSEALAVVEQLEQLMTGLDPLQRQMLELRLQDHTIEEIAAQVDRSERTVRRLLDKVKDRFEQ